MYFRPAKRTITGASIYSAMEVGQLYVRLIKSLLASTSRQPRRLTEGSNMMATSWFSRSRGSGITCSSPIPQDVLIPNQYRLFAIEGSSGKSSRRIRHLVSRAGSLFEVPQEPKRITEPDQMEITMHSSQVNSYDTSQFYNQWFRKCFG